MKGLRKNQTVELEITKGNHTYYVVSGNKAGFVVYRSKGNGRALIFGTAYQTVEAAVNAIELHYKKMTANF